MTKDLIRIGFGLTAIGALLTWLWPSDWSSSIQEGGNIIATVSAIVVWIAAEFKLGTNTIAKQMVDAVEVDTKAKQLDETDKEIIEIFAWLFDPNFRRVFGADGFPRKFSADLLGELNIFLEKSEEAWFQISDAEINSKLMEFVDAGREFTRNGLYAFDIPHHNTVEVRPEVFDQVFEPEVRNRFPDLTDEQLRLSMLSEASNRLVESGDVLLSAVRMKDPSFYEGNILSIHHQELGKS